MVDEDEIASVYEKEIDIYGEMMKLMKDYGSLAGVTVENTTGGYMESFMMMSKNKGEFESRIATASLIEGEQKKMIVAKLDNKTVDNRCCHVI